MLIKSSDDKACDLALLANLPTDKLNQQQLDWLKEKQWALKTGIQGEKDAAYYINSEFKDSETYAVLHDLRIEVDGDIAQIDHLIIGHYFVFLIETKNFNGNITINECGEFSVDYANGKTIGIPSPIEQSHRHEKILAKLFKQLKIQSFLDKPLEFHHLVLVSPKSIINRPKSAESDSLNVIKADNLRAWKEKFLEKEASFLRLATLVPKVFLKPKLFVSPPNAETLKKYGEMIIQYHQPTPPLVLPKFMQPKEVESEPSHHCTTCKKIISSAEARFCNIHKDRFNGNLYCREHQQSFSKVNKNNISQTTEKEPVLCAEANCGKILSDAVISYCLEHKKRFNGKLYCMTHQKLKTAPMPSENKA